MQAHLPLGALRAGAKQVVLVCAGAVQHRALHLEVLPRSLSIARHTAHHERLKVCPP